jgi:hypothetical protein
MLKGPFADETKFMTEKSDTPLEEVLARQQLDLERLKDALGLLGVSACCWCKKFLRRSDRDLSSTPANWFATAAFMSGGHSAARN